jgi:predicted Abi (CAAX) family protease
MIHTYNHCVSAYIPHTAWQKPVGSMIVGCRDLDAQANNLALSACDLLLPKDKWGITSNPFLKYVCLYAIVIFIIYSPISELVFLFRCVLVRIYILYIYACIFLRICCHVIYSDLPIPVVI